MTPVERLEALVASAADLSRLDLKARLQWLEDSAAALEALDLGEAGRDAALHLRAALGAVVRWAQSPVRDTAEAKAQLEILLKTLMASGTSGMYRALAASYAEVAASPGAPAREALVQVRDAFLEAADSVEGGEPVSAATVEKIKKARASLPK